MTIRQQPKDNPTRGWSARLRQPKGTPTGGQFARSRRGDDDDLMFSVPDEGLVRGATDPTLASDLIGRVRAGRYDPNKPLHRFAADGSIESLDYAQLSAEATAHRAEIQRTIQTIDPDLRATHDFDGVLTAAMRPDASGGILAEAAHRLSAANPNLGWADAQPDLERLTGVAYDDPNMNADMLARAVH